MLLYVFGNAFLLVLVLLELFIMKVINKDCIDFKDVVFNLNSGHIMLWVIRSLELGIFHFISQHLSLSLMEGLSPYVLWIVAIIAWDFSFYWYHRIHHKYRWLWYIHVVHHEGEEFNLSLGIRNSWYSALTTIPFFAWMAVIGVPFYVFAVVSIGHYFIQFLNHNSLIKDIGIFRYIFVSPLHHKVHHGKQAIYSNKNFGGTFVWWDHLFGTHQDEVADQPVEVGISRPLRTYNLFQANNFRFLKDLGIYFNKISKRSYDMPNWFLLLLTSITFCGFLSYVNIESVASFSTKSKLFLVIFIAINAIGGLSEGRKWGVFLWAINIILVAPLILSNNTISFSVFWIFAIILITTVVLTCIYAYKYRLATHM